MRESLSLITPLLGNSQSLGSSEGADPTFLTEYVATRWYRAPEVLLTWCKYTKALDMWSVGCIFAELMGRRPVFPGKNYKHQIELICNVLGTPNVEDLKSVTSQKALQFLQSLKDRPKRRFCDIYSSASDKAISLLEHLLLFDPEKRFTVEQCLAHPFLESLHDPNDEPGGLGTLDFTWEAQIGPPVQAKMKLKEVILTLPYFSFSPAPRNVARMCLIGDDDDDDEEKLKCMPRVCLILRGPISRAVRAPPSENNLCGSPPLHVPVLAFSLFGVGYVCCACSADALPPNRPTALVWGDSAVSSRAANMGGRPVRVRRLATSERPARRSHFRRDGVCGRDEDFALRPAWRTIEISHRDFFPDSGQTTIKVFVILECVVFPREVSSPLLHLPCTRGRAVRLRRQRAGLPGRPLPARGITESRSLGQNTT